MKPHAVGVNHGKEQIMKMIKIKAVCYDDLITSDRDKFAGLNLNYRS